MIDLNNTFAFYSAALDLRDTKTALISSNIINQDTPGYKAKDISFQEAMNEMTMNMNEAKEHQDFSNKNSGIAFANDAADSEHYIQYRNVASPSADGNTVNSHYEKIAFMDNSIRYNSTLAFIQAKKASFMQVIKGE